VFDGRRNNCAVISHCDCDCNFRHRQTSTKLWSKWTFVSWMSNDERTKLRLSYGVSRFISIHSFACFSFAYIISQTAIFLTCNQS